MELQLQTAEATLLRNILERYLGDFRMEIGKTENFKMRNDMKADEATLVGILGQLGVTVSAPH
jgi:hypothetical protein